MTYSRTLLSATVMLGSIGTGFAQYGIYDLPLGPSRGIGKSNNLYLGVELTRFGGREKNSLGETFTGHENGYLIVVDQVLGKPTRGKPFTVLGGWLWTESGGSAIYEVHVKHFIMPQFGGQLAINKSKGNGITDWSLFAIFNHMFWSKNAGQKSLFATLGVGAYEFTDSEADFTGTEPTAFLQLSAELGGGWRANASYWYIQTPRPSGEFNRASIGIGKRF